ncbi:MAG: toll/interleukin-1 receptor domain-containing protein [Candidatus Marinimicrobia bacterium]|nr:toll/interleukin-1 receptor domain-containing protein [Candidatus Neomarinimicrobiota bacterium]
MSADNIAFLSYSSEDKALAESIKTAIETEFSNGIKLFLYQDYENNKPGEEWWNNIKDALESSNIVFVLATPNSIKKPWINFEAGTASLRKIRIDGEKDKEKNVVLLPLCAKGLSKSEIGLPLSIVNALDLDNSEDVKKMMKILAENYGYSYMQHADLKGIINQASHLKRKPVNFEESMDAMGISNLLLRKNLTTESFGLRWNQLEKRCKKSMRILGWSNMNVLTGQSRIVFKELVTNGNRKLEWLLLDSSKVSKATTLNFGPVCNQEHSTILKDLDEGIAQMRDFYSRLDKKYRKNIEVRRTNWTMSWSSVAVDLNEANGLLQVDLYTFGINPDSRPEIVLYPKSGGFYEVFRKSIENMWNEAKVIELS